MLAVYITLGHTKGQKVLPVPAAWELEDALPTNQHSDADAADSIHFLEATVIGWMHVMKDVFSTRPEIALQVHCQPLTL